MATEYELEDVHIDMPAADTGPSGRTPIGVAVGDVDGLQKIARENRTKLQIDLVLSLEELLESLGIRHHFSEMKAIRPNKQVHQLLQVIMGTDEYSTSEVKISDAIKPPPESIEKQLQKQCQKLEAKLQEQSERFETKLKEQLEVKLKEHSEKQRDQFQEAVRQLSECHKEQAKPSEDQTKKMEEKTEQLAGEVASLREALEKLVTQLATK